MMNHLLKKKIAEFMIIPEHAERSVLFIWEHIDPWLFSFWF
jgi:hypothetical protein